MKAIITSIEPAGSAEECMAVQVEFTEDGVDFPRSAGVEVWIENNRASGLTLQEIENLAAAEAYRFLQEVLDTWSKST